jgi:NAD+ synthase (glutamine-hydrolysing)
MNQSFGYIHVGAVSLDVSLGNINENIENHIRFVKEADLKNIQVLTFQELSITGYSLGDMFLNATILKEAKKGLNKLLEKTKDTNVLFTVGIPIKHEMQLFNTAAVCYKGNLLAFVPKTFIPNYNEFYEKRYFKSGNNINENMIEYDGKLVPVTKDIIFIDRKSNAKVAIEICEDLWTPIPPSSNHALHGANVILNLSASNELVGKMHYRQDLVNQQAARTFSTYVYASAGKGESTSDLVYSGHSMISESGVMTNEMRYESNKIISSYIDVEKLEHNRAKHHSYTDVVLGDYLNIYFESNELNLNDIKPYIDSNPFVPQNPKTLDEHTSEIMNIQARGLAHRLDVIHSNKLTVGISGGLDSTLALLVAIEAMKINGADNSDITAITMPGFGTSDRTLNNALMLMDEFGVTQRTISIVPTTTQHLKDINHDINIENVVFENAQARERTQILMDVANQVGGIVLGTGDLSEIALGWATYNADHMSMYNVNASIPKSLVRHIIKWYADQQTDVIKEILYDILDTPVSPELLSLKDGEIDQKTEDVIGPYELHDFFIYNFIRHQFGVEKIFLLACKAFEDKYSKHIIYKWFRLFMWRFLTQQFKRQSMPDGVKVGSVSLSQRGDWRMPSDLNPSMFMNQLDLIKDKYKIEAI